MLKGKIVFSSTFVMVMMTFSVALILMIENLRFTEPSRGALALLVYKLQIDSYEVQTQLIVIYSATLPLIHEYKL